MTVPTVAPTLATMIGLGVGIDYALFIVTRHFRGLDDGLEVHESIARASRHLGRRGVLRRRHGHDRAGLAGRGRASRWSRRMGLMAAIAVVVAVLAALTLLPAVLGLVGRHINSLRVRRRRPDREAQHGLWARWAADIAKQPLVAGLIALAILIPLTIPLLSLTLGQQDVAALSTSTTARRAYDLIAKNFGPGVNGPLLIARSPQVTGHQHHDSRLQTLQKDISSTPGVAAVTPTQIDKAGTTAYFNAISTTGPGRAVDLGPGQPTCAARRSPRPKRAPTCAPTWAAAPPATSTWPPRSPASCRCRSWS